MRAPGHFPLHRLSRPGRMNRIGQLALRLNGNMPLSGGRRDCRLPGRSFYIATFPVACPAGFRKPDKKNSMRFPSPRPRAFPLQGRRSVPEETATPGKVPHEVFLSGLGAEPNPAGPQSLHSPEGWFWSLSQDTGMGSLQKLSLTT